MVVALSYSVSLIAVIIIVGTFIVLQIPQEDTASEKTSCCCPIDYQIHAI